jgi:hypothetical protein
MDIGKQAAIRLQPSLFGTFDDCYLGEIGKPAADGGRIGALT